MAARSVFNKCENEKHNAKLTPLPIPIYSVKKKRPRGAVAAAETRSRGGMTKMNPRQGGGGPGWDGGDRGRWRTGGEEDGGEKGGRGSRETTGTAGTNSKIYLARFFTPVFTFTV